jgi:HD superfamily phosphohydrolase
LPLKFTTEIRDVVHGYVYISDVERQVIDTPVFQRLRHIKQLAGVSLTYPGAQHTRFEHSLGVMHLAGLAAFVLGSKTARFGDETIQLIRLAALCHDLGHGPYSHLFEEAMGLRYGFNHQRMTRELITKTEVSDVLAKNGYEPSEVADLSTGRSTKLPAFVNEMLAGSVNVDTMDYLLRDSHHAGVEYGKFDVQRLIYSFEVLGDRLALDRAALYTLEAYAISRYEMFKAVYFHRTVRAAESMLLRAIELTGPSLKRYVEDVNEYKTLDDSMLLSLIMMQGGLARKLVQDVLQRRLVKCVFEKLYHKRDDLVERLFTQRSVRTAVEAEIAAKAGVEPTSVYLDVPTTPSLPYTPDQRQLEGIVIVSTSGDGTRRYEYTPVQELPIISSLAGHIYMLRVYATQESRERVARVVEEILRR